MKKRRLSILLSIVMLFSLLPTTAFAASYAKISVNDIDLQDGEYLADNRSTSAQTATAAPSTYVAWYKDGVLTLNGYEGTGIQTQGAAAGELTVKLIGTNSINNGSLVSDNGGNIIVTSDSSGTLSITKTISDSNNRAIGIETGLSSSHTTGNVTITGSADVKIEVTHNGKNGQEDAYGIFAKENITISEKASVDITCATPKNTEALGSYCNGLHAKNVTIETDGKIKINVTTAGADSTQSFGIYPMGSATLTKVGEMEVQWKKHKTNTSYPGGAVKGGASFSDTDYAINVISVDETKCYASYRNGQPYEVMVVNGQLTGPGVPNASGSGIFLENDTVNITPDEKKGRSGEEIPFKEWTSEGVTLDKSATTASNFFTVPGKNVTVTAMHNPFVGAPTFKPTGMAGNEGTLTFTAVVDPYDGSEGFYLVKEVDVDTTGKYISISPSKTSTGSPHVYSNTVYLSTVPAGNYYVIEKLNNAYYPSEKFTVNYSAAPAGNYPDSVRVYNANKKLIGLGDGECLTANEAERATSYTGDPSYVARYDKSSGTLYLKDYQGVGENGGITATSDLNIVVESDSTFTTSRTASTDTLMGIQANGKLNISGSGKLTVTANGNGDVYGIYANEGVTISAPLVVNVGKVDPSKNGLVYGIYTQSGAISLSDNDKTITATGGMEAAYGVYNKAQTSSTAADNGNINISGKLTVSPSNGTSNYGIYTGIGGTITLDAATLSIQSGFDCGIYNNDGNVVIKNSPDVTLNSDKSGSRGIWTNHGGNLTIENSTVKVSAKGLVAELKGNVSIKDSMVDLTRTSSDHEVIRTDSSAENRIDLSGSGTVTLTAPDKQEYAMIGGKVTATSGTKVEKGTYNSGWKNYKGEYDSANNKTVLKFVHKSTAPTANISLNKTDTVDFGSAEAGYSTAPTAETVTITNNGTAATGPLTITLEGTHASSFTLSTNNIADVAASGGTGTFTVQPNVGLIAGTYTATVKVSGTGTGTGVTEQSFGVKFTVTAPLTAIAVPAANTGLVYDGTKKTGVNAGEGYTLGGTYEAIDVGATDYTATATLKTGYKWDGGSNDVKTINWNIGKRTPSAADFTFAPPADLTYDGNDKTASVTLNSSFTNSGAITVKYEKDGASVTETENVGTYTVKIDVAGGDNFNAGSNLNDPTWKFSIAPAVQSAPTTLGVEAPTASGGKGKIFGTTNKMEYNTNAAATSGWMACSATETEVAHGTYYVRYKADANHKAGAVATVTVPAYSETRYSITVNNDGHGTANANKTSAVAGETIILTATPNSGYVFGQWTDKTPDSLSIDPNGKFTMPGKNVSVKATFTKTSGGGSSSGGGGGGGGGGAAPATPQKPEIKPVTGGKVSLSADGTTATITPDAGKVVDKVLVNGKDMGAVTELKGLKTGDKIEVLFKDEVKEPSKAETDKQVKAHMQKLAPKARSLKTKAGNVKVSFEGQFKDIEALGYTVKYKFYRSTKKASGYKHMLTTSKPSYTNTYGKKGTLYYYKAIALAYDKDGKLIAKTELKQCKYASRRWTK